MLDEMNGLEKVALHLALSGRPTRPLTEDENRRLERIEKVVEEAALAVPEYLAAVEKVEELADESCAFRRVRVEGDPRPTFERNGRRWVHAFHRSPLGSGRFVWSHTDWVHPVRVGPTHRGRWIVVVETEPLWSRIPAPDGRGYWDSVGDAMVSAGEYMDSHPEGYED